MMEAVESTDGLRSAQVEFLSGGMLALGMWRSFLGEGWPRSEVIQLRQGAAARVVGFAKTLERVKF